MALKAVHVSDVLCFDKVSETSELTLPSSSASTPCFSQGSEDSRAERKVYELPGKFLVMGHRGYGMNMLQSPDRRMKSVKENSVVSFNAAAGFPVDFIEFDVQVTKDECPVIFHDNFIITKLDHGELMEKRVTELTLDEFLSYGPQREPGNVVGRPLFRRTKDGRIFEWKVEDDAPLCTLHEVFENVDSTVGFNVELKFDDHMAYKETDLARILQAVLRVVHDHAKDRAIIFSSFHPDAALLTRKLQCTYPVLFLTNGGSEIFADARRNSLDEAMKVCLSGRLQGIVSEVKAVLRNPGAVALIKESCLSFITYGQLNNIPEVVYMQHRIGVGGVIVDLVKEITAIVSDFMTRSSEEAAAGEDIGGFKGVVVKGEVEISLLLKFIPELIQQSCHQSI
ncbi:hypothetical protein SAY87_005390 [Trapa incisa]|uniref:glycerophosphodiester phosphodiesterase n=1 Tax=Trapa incisa TaxID=236973 RepID=A0AAN7K6D0_9MYRT|nr:hypothetical protein SAY87_005390 [Trapa incisa]